MILSIKPAPALRALTVLNAVTLLMFITLGLSAAPAATELSLDKPPPAPPRYFNDYAGVVSPDTANSLNQALENFEKSDNSQVLVAIYPQLPPRAALEDFTIRAASAWRVGQKARDNGAILFVFINDRRMRIEVGYGLEGRLTDALSKRIIEEQIKPWFQQGNYDGGLTAGVNAILQGVRGEYKGTGQTAANRGSRKGPGSSLFWLLFLFLFLLPALRRRGTIFSPRGRRGYWGAGPWIGGGFSGGGGGGFSGGGGFGGFSGGGGGFGGGGASGGW